MRLIHTLLFFFRENKLPQDIPMATECLKSLEKSAYKTVVVYNQGCISQGSLKAFLEKFDLDAHIIGEGKNVGTTVGRQSCFAYIWEHFPDTEYISEIHLDMIFAPRWEEPLIRYLDTHEEPLIGCGIVDQQGRFPFLNKTAALPASHSEYDDFLLSLRQDSVLDGFSNPCIHVSKILKQIGGYNAEFLKGSQCFEDDSMLLGYYYYYGTKADWRPKINFNSVVYHAIAGQRIGIGANIMVNFSGLVKQYGAMGLLRLSTLHNTNWHRNFFLEQYKKLTQ